MSALHPTPTRIALLQDTANGLIVAGARNWGIFRDERLAPFYDPMTATRTAVTSRARLLEEEGWIELGANHTYRLTDNGRAVLVAAQTSEEATA